VDLNDLQAIIVTESVVAA